MAVSGPDPTEHPLSIRPVSRQTADLLRRHWEILWPIAAALFFLPQLLISVVAPASRGQSPPEISASIPFVVVGIVVIVATIVGQLTIAFIAVNNGTAGRTVGEVLVMTGRRMVPALAVVAAQSIAVLAGGLLFIIPGLWLLARLSVAMPIIATGSDDPTAALKQSWQLSRGYVLRILGCLAGLLGAVLLFYVLVMALGTITGALHPSTVNLPSAQWNIGRWLFEIASAAVAATMGLVATCFYAVLLLRLRRLPRMPGMNG